MSCSSIPTRLLNSTVKLPRVYGRQLVRVDLQNKLALFDCVDESYLIVGDIWATFEDKSTKREV